MDRSDPEAVVWRNRALMLFDRVSVPVAVSDVHGAVRLANPAVEGRVLELLAGGATTAQAARETGLTTDGVGYHLRRLSARWGAGSRTELVARAYALGVLTSGVWPPVASSA
ncbi:LuxR C-terminal-related transcriptional regulator [Streptomyces sviceus]|uniref:LuxR C-terminal-related transcriptional regulator n=1 Tax=Streptomyces sviceus TaxID=285530 RepID=UPI0036CA9CD2